MEPVSMAQKVDFDAIDQFTPLQKRILPYVEAIFSTLTMKNQHSNDETEANSLRGIPITIFAQLDKLHKAKASLITAQSNSARITPSPASHVSSSKSNTSAGMLTVTRKNRTPSSQSSKQRATAMFSNTDPSSPASDWETKSRNRSVLPHVPMNLNLNC